MGIAQAIAKLRAGVLDLLSSGRPVHVQTRHPGETGPMVADTEVDPRSGGATVLTPAPTEVAALHEAVVEAQQVSLAELTSAVPRR